MSSPLMWCHLRCPAEAGVDWAWWSKLGAGLLADSSQQVGTSLFAPAASLSAYSAALVVVCMFFAFLSTCCASNAACLQDRSDRLQVAAGATAQRVAGGGAQIGTATDQSDGSSEVRYRDSRQNSSRAYASQ